LISVDNIFWSHLVTNTSASYTVQRFKKPDGEKPRRLARMAALCRYLNRSQMSMWRWTHDESLNFPKPIVIRRVKYYDLDEVDGWLRERVAG
jgi:predicted DNA-binding transcriptional regulator AlpA